MAPSAVRLNTSTITGGTQSIFIQARCWPKGRKRERAVSVVGATSQRMEHWKAKVNTSTESETVHGDFSIHQGRLLRRDSMKTTKLWESGFTTMKMGQPARRASL